MRPTLSLTRLSIIVLGLSISMWIAAYMFRMNEVIDHPQFGYLHQFGEIVKEIEKNDYQQRWYNLFFILDFIWAPLLLWLIYRWIRWLIAEDTQHWILWRSFRWSLFVSSILAYIFDILENISYITFCDHFLGCSLSTFTNVKVFFYALVFIHLFCAIYHKYLSKNLRLIANFLRASIISLLIVILLGLLLTQLDQGATVIVHLLDHPENLIAAFFLINMLALACSHYPTYIDMRINNPSNITWHLDPIFKLFEFLGMGLITYKSGNAQHKSLMQNHRPIADNELFDELRKNLGTAFLVTWVFVLLSVYKQFVDSSFALNTYMIILVALTVIFSYYCSLKRSFWKRHVSNNEAAFRQLDEHLEVYRKLGNGNLEHLRSDANALIPRSIQFYLKFTLVSFGVFLIFFLISILLIFFGGYGWSAFTWTLILISSIINVVPFILFQNFRTAFRYFIPTGFLRFIPLYWLKSDLKYVGFFALTGYVNLAIILLSYRFPTKLNPLVIILSYLYFYYGFLIVFIKHRIYYQKANGLIFSRKARMFFHYYAPILGLVFVVLVFYMASKGNNLHTLRPVPETARQIETDTFTKQLSENLNNSNRPLYLISSYGGGLRAHAWTMLLLDSLYNSNPEVFETTAAMSGVSGGFLGLSMFTAIRTEHHHPLTRERIIDSIGNHNLLAIDLTYLLGYDFFREQIILFPNHLDRAGRSSKEYARILQPGKSKEKMLRFSTYRNYFEKSFAEASSKDQFLPALIGNTTGTHSRYGIAYSLKTNEFDSIFPGAIDILNSQNNSSITYLDATSSTERFPIFSPAAKIKGKGHFLDGGYFENSGLLSANNFLDYLKKQDAIISGRPKKMILIINSKEDYIRHVLGEETIPTKDPEMGELSAILRTVSDIVILPSALESRFENIYGKENFIRIFLPYPISFDDVVNEMGIPEDPFEVLKKIQASNSKIVSTLDSAGYNHFGIVYPPLARVLSEPAYDYIKAMRIHTEVVNSFDKIRN